MIILVLHAVGISLANLVIRSGDEQEYTARIFHELIASSFTSGVALKNLLIDVTVFSAASGSVFCSPAA